MNDIMNYIWINGEDKPIERQLCTVSGLSFAIKGYYINCNSNITVAELSYAIDNGLDPDNPMYKSSVFSFTVNGKNILNIPIKFIPITPVNDDKFKSSLLCSHKNFIISSDDIIGMSIDFWDNKPRKYINVVVILEQLISGDLNE